MCARMTSHAGEGEQLLGWMLQEARNVTVEIT